MLRMIQKVTAPLKRRVMLMIGRCVLTVVTDTTKAQTLQIESLEDEVKDDVERFQEYGFTSVPGADVEGIVVYPGGNRGHPVVVATEDRVNRPTGLSEGEVALYTIANNIRVLLKSDGLVELGTTPTNFVALANLVLTELQSIKTDFDSHTHTITGGSSAGTTSAPDSPMTAPSSVAATEVKAK